MSSVNKAIILGRLGVDPEVRYMPNGRAVVNLSIATSTQWKDKDSGEKREKTEWHRVSLFDRQAEIAGEYLRKGSLAYIEGRIETRKWQDKDGADRYTTEIIADQMKLVGGRDSGGGMSGGGDYAAGGRGAPAQGASQPAAAAQPVGSVAELDDDIPF